MSQVQEARGSVRWLKKAGLAVSVTIVLIVALLFAFTTGNIAPALITIGLLFLVGRIAWAQDHRPRKPGEPQCQWEDCDMPALTKRRVYCSLHYDRP